MTPLDQSGFAGGSTIVLPVPKALHDARRLRELEQGIAAFVAAKRQPPQEWVDEANSLRPAARMVA